MSTANQPLLDLIFTPASVPKPVHLTGEDLKQSGMGSVLGHTPDWYKDAFRSAVESFHKGRLFTVEDIRAIVGDPPDSVSSNCMGSLMVMVSKKKLATKTGFYVKAKRECMNATELAQWRKL